MAATAAASRLTEAHRLAQARLAAQTIAQALASWGLLDPADLAGSTTRWLTVLLPLLSAQQRASVALAANYLSTFRVLELEGDPGPFRPVPAAALDLQAAASSLLFTGPGTVRRALGRSVPLAVAFERGKAEAARAASRHVLNGGRTTILGTVAADKRALGWARATSGKTCHFCAMLAGRGPVYKAEGTADFKAHDGCNCTTEPVYRRDAAWPPGSRRFAEQYRQAKAVTPAGEDVTNTFRRLLAGTTA